MSGVVIGVDVGTGSARAGLFDLEGTLLASAVEPIQKRSRAIHGSRYEEGTSSSASTGG